MLINGYEYSWGDIQVVLPGKTIPVDGITAIEYSSKQDKPNIYARGFKPVARGRSKIEFSGKVTILQGEFEAMVKAITGKSDPLALPMFPITVSYAPEGGVVVTDKLIQCEFTDWKKGMKTGDPNMEIEMNLVIGDMKLNV